MIDNCIYGCIIVLDLGVCVMFIHTCIQLNLADISMLCYRENVQSNHVHKSNMANIGY